MIGPGQLNVVPEMISEDYVPKSMDQQPSVKLPTSDDCETARDMMDGVNEMLGFSRGASPEIGHRHNDPRCMRAYEVSKVLMRNVTLNQNSGGSLRWPDRAVHAGRGARGKSGIVAGAITMRCRP